MISKKDKEKLKNAILYGLYEIYHETNSLSVDSSIIFSACLSRTCDEHDIALAIRSLKADGFVDVEFCSNDVCSSDLSITQKGIDYCYQNRENKLIKYIKQNHLAIIAIIVSIVALFN